MGHTPWCPLLGEIIVYSDSIVQNLFGISLSFIDTIPRVLNGKDVYFQQRPHIIEKLTSQADIFGVPMKVNQQL
jgi:hypothetical protein